MNIKGKITQEPFPTFSITTLGCSKNKVDSSKVISILERHGFHYVSCSIKPPDIFIVNTCAFTKQARAATEVEIFSLYNKLSNYPTKLVVMGCYVNYNNTLHNSLKGMVDAYIPFNNYIQTPQICLKLLKVNQQIDIKRLDLYPLSDSYHKTFLNINSSYKLLPGKSAFLKISEGCSNRCHFCSIPNIKGRQISRTIEDIYDEAKYFAEQGIVELNIIGQDTTSYGIDIYGSTKLVKLLKNLLAINSFKWIRIHYCYPSFFSEELIELFSAQERICPYIDIPLQHINDIMLRKMGRKYNRKFVFNLLEKIKTKVPEAQFITSFIVGYPGETETIFEELGTFVGQGWFRYVNCFPYSKEPETRAFKLKDNLSQKIKNERVRTIQKKQFEIFNNIAKKSVGSIIPVLVEERTKDFRLKYNYPWTGRSIWDAPEDSKVFISSAASVEPGKIYDIVIENWENYRLIGSALKARNYGKSESKKVEHR